MLERVSASSLDALFSSVPDSHRRTEPLNLEPSLDEATLMSHLEALADANTPRVLSFLGGGAYEHHIPPAVDQLLLRSEFYTAYTPYQPEVAQGTLQSIFEFQTTVCELFGTEVANASMYDGASGCAEAALMARRITGRTRIVVSDGVHPEYRAALVTYLRGLAGGGEPELDVVPMEANGTTDLSALRERMGEDVAAVIVGYPNILGSVEPLGPFRDVATDSGALLVVTNWEPYAMGVVRPPGAMADIVVGEGQSLAVPPQFGGPGVGLFACRKKYVRQIPGRLVGETVDQAGKRGYVLTLSTREQHIRRERATSNICTNHGLIALAFTIRAALLGRSGFERVSRNCLSKTEYLKARFRDSERFEVVNSAATFNEITVRCRSGNDADSLLGPLEARGVFAGVRLGNWFPERSDQFLVAVTERHSKDQLDALVTALEG